MSGIKDKLKQAKEKVLGEGPDSVEEPGSGPGKGGSLSYDNGEAGTEAVKKDDPLTSYREKEPMPPAKISEHEPTAVKREMTEKIVERDQTGTNSQEAAELARKKGMAKGTSGAAETGSEYEQGAAGSNR